MGKKEGVWLDIGRIVAAWLLYLVALRVLQKMGYPVGFSVWPMGEDRNWLSWLQRGHGSEIARMFWQTNDRNPVSPWWYIAFKPIILGKENGILYVRYAMSLLCGVSAYLMLRALGSRFFALAVGILCAIFTANGYVDNIYWNFIGALSMSLLCIWAYTEYLRTASVHWYGFSIVLWFFALSSYTLQSGAVLAVAYLAYASGGEKLTANVLARLWRATKDTLPYLGVFAVFLLIWRTTSTPSMTQYYKMEFSSARLLQSISEGIWHPVFPVFAAWATRPLSQGAEVLVLIVMAAGVFALMPRASSPSQTAGRAIRDITVVALCIAAPTVAVESMSDIWGPGSRWRMLHQLWVPLLGGSVLALVYLAIGRVIPERSGRLWPALVAVSAFFFAAVNLGHNQEQVVSTATEKRIFTALSDILAKEGIQAGGSVSHFLVRLDPGAAWISQDVMSPVYASTWFPDSKISLRVFSTVGPHEASDRPWFDIKFGEDTIENIEVGGGSAPYSDVRVLAFDGTTVRSLEGASAKDFEGLRVKWERKEPLPLNKLEALDKCNYKWTPDKKRAQSNFSEPESDELGPFQWTIGKQARISLPPCEGDIEVKITAAFALSDKNIEEFSASVDGRPIALSRSAGPGGVVYKGVVRSDGPMTMTLDVPETLRPAGGNRDLGIALRGIELRQK